MAFRAASGDLLGNYTPKVAVFAHPTDATGTKGDFEGGTTSIEASFDFHPLKTRELKKGRTLGHFGHLTPSRGGAPSGQASVAVGLGCPWDPSGRRRPVRAIN